MIQSWNGLYVFIGLQLLLLGVWLWKFSRKLSRKTRVFWTVVLVTLFLVPDLGIYCGLSGGGLGCLGILVLFGIPWTIACLLVISAILGYLVSKVVGFLSRNNSSGPNLPGPGWAWIFGILIFIWILTQIVLKVMSTIS